jgi:FAD/FMN-containing dehydrogenase
MVDQPFRPEPVTRGEGVLPPTENPSGRLIIRVNVRPGDVANLLQAAGQRSDIRIHGQVGSGILRLAFDPSSLEFARGILLDLVETSAQLHRSIVIERCPTEWKTLLPVWGKESRAITLMNSVKRALDPQNIFNPGRFVTDAF